MAELIVTKKEIWPQLKEATRNLAGGTRGPGAGGQRLPLAGRYGAEHSTLWFLVRGALSGGVCRLRTCPETSEGTMEGICGELWGR